MQEGTLTYWVQAVDNSGNYSKNGIKAVISVFNIPSKNVILERVEDLSTWTGYKIYRSPITGYWMIDSDKTIGEMEHFSDIFNSNSSLSDDAYVILTPIDLGANIIEENYFYYDPWGNIRLRTTKTVQDYDDFFDLFTEQNTYVEPQYKLVTFANIDIDWERNVNNYINIFYRISFDGISYGSWIPMNSKLFFGRYIQFKICIGSIDGTTNVLIKGATIKIDVPDMIEMIPYITISATGTTKYYFKQRFYAAPFPKLYSYDDSNKQCTHEIVNVTKEYLEVRLWNGETQITGKIYGEVDGC
jgi:hypothetical protein